MADWNSFCVYEQSSQRMTWPPSEAALDRRHHLQLAEADVTCIGFTPSGPVVAEDIRDLRVGRAMIAVAYAGGFFSDVSGVSRSNGLMTARITLVATCA